MAQSPRRGFLSRVGAQILHLQGGNPHADAMLKRVEGVFSTMERVLSAELRILSKLEPLVDDLAQLVRLELDEALERRGFKRSSRTPPTSSQTESVLEAEVLSRHSKVSDSES